MDTGRRHKTPGSETKDLLPTATAVSRVSAFPCASFSSPNSQGNVKMARWHPHVQWVVLQERQADLRESKSSLNTESRYACPLLWRQMLLLFLRLFVTQAYLERQSRTKIVLLQDVQNYKRPMEKCHLTRPFSCCQLSPLARMWP